LGYGPKAIRRTLESLGVGKYPAARVAGFES
jgi:hypothetical protein